MKDDEQPGVLIKTLASGSSGNATYIRFGDRRILVDAGISKRKIDQGLALVGEGVTDLDAVMLTHAHSDHIKGLARLLESDFRGELVATRGTAREVGKKLEREVGFTAVEAGFLSSFGAVEVMPFRVAHDAAEPVGYRFDYGGFSLGYATDMGRVNREVSEVIEGCRVLLVEANYDEEMLRWGPYPKFLKRRIAGAGGHLSNAQSRALVKAVKHKGLEQVVLIHLSEKNNQVEKAVEAVSEVLPRAVKVVAAPRKKAGESRRFSVGETPGLGVSGGSQLALF